MSNYTYDKNTRLLLINYSESSSKKKQFELSSEPIKINNDIYFIHPFEWECKGDLIKINLTTGEIDKKLSVDSKDYTIKDIQIVEKTVFLLIGFMWGTVAKGGDLYKCSLNLKNLELVHKFDDKTQITNIISKSNKDLLLDGIEYIDDEFNEYKNITIKIEI